MPGMTPKSASDIVPVTLISGFAGVGKTTLIDHLRSQVGADKLVVFKDDGEEDLIEVLTDATENIKPGGSVIIEVSANLEPYPIVEFFEENPLPSNIRIDSLVTVIDGSTFLETLFDSADLQSMRLAIDEDDNRSSAEVMMEQIEFADIILINKKDLIAANDLETLATLLGRLNPHAQVYSCSQGRVPSEEILGAGLFHLEETDSGAGWLAELQGDFDEVDDTDGVSSFTYLEHRPFHPGRFSDMIAEFSAQGLVRAKGSLWMATRHNEIGLWNVAGRASVIASAGMWFAATPSSEWPEDEGERLEIMEDWVPPFGDRRQEIAFIGIDLDEGEIRDQLDACLLTHDEMRDGPESWNSLKDPLPAW